MLLFFENSSGQLSLNLVSRSGVETAEEVLKNPSWTTDTEDGIPMMLMYYQFLQAPPETVPNVSSFASSSFSTPKPIPGSSSKLPLDREGEKTENNEHYHALNVGNNMDNIPLVEEKTLLNMLANLADTTQGIASPKSQKNEVRVTSVANDPNLYDTNDAMLSMINILKENTSGNMVCQDQSTFQNSRASENMCPVGLNLREVARSRPHEDVRETPQTLHPKGENLMGNSFRIFGYIEAQMSSVSSSNSSSSSWSKSEWKDRPTKRKLSHVEQSLSESIAQRSLNESSISGESCQSYNSCHSNSTSSHDTTGLERAHSSFSHKKSNCKVTKYDVQAEKLCQVASTVLERSKSPGAHKIGACRPYSNSSKMKSKNRIKPTFVAPLPTALSLAASNK